LDGGVRVYNNEATTENLWSEPDVISNATLNDDEHSGRIDATQAAPEEDDVVSNLLSTVPSYDSNLLATVSSYECGGANMTWTDIVEDKGDKVAINVAIVTGDDVDEEERDLQERLNKLTVRKLKFESLKVNLSLKSELNFTEASLSIEKVKCEPTGITITVTSLRSHILV